MSSPFDAHSAPRAAEHGAAMAPPPRGLAIIAGMALPHRASITAPMPARLAVVVIPLGRLILHMPHQMIVEEDGLAAGRGILYLAHHGNVADRRCADEAARQMTVEDDNPAPPPRDKLYLGRHANVADRRGAEARAI